MILRDLTNGLLILASGVLVAVSLSQVKVTTKFDVMKELNKAIYLNTSTTDMVALNKWLADGWVVKLTEQFGQSGVILVVLTKHVQTPDTSSR